MNYVCAEVGKRKTFFSFCTTTNDISLEVHVFLFTRQSILTASESVFNVICNEKASLDGITLLNLTSYFLCKSNP